MTDRQKAYGHCLTLKMCLNNNVQKICIDKETKIDFFKIITNKKIFAR